MAQKRKMTESPKNAQQTHKRSKSTQSTKSTQSQTVDDSIHRYKAYVVPKAQADTARERGQYGELAKLGNGFDWNFVVETAKGFTPWQAIRKYKNVKLDGTVFSHGDVIYVMNNEKLPKAPGEDRPDHEHLRYEQKNFWVAKLIEARAQHDKEVLLLVAWLYWPDELPNKSCKQFHGKGETILSNSLDVIDAMTISAKASDLLFYNEADDDEVGRLPERFWRQTFDARIPRKNECLSQLRKFCRCNQPHLPGTRMFQCIRTECYKWLHQQCLVNEVGEQAWSSYQNQDMEGYAASHKPKTEDTLAKTMLNSSVHAISQFLNNSTEQKLEDGVQAVKEETSIKLESTDGTPSNKSTKRQGKSKQSKSSWPDKLEVTIIVEESKSLYARVKEKGKDGRIWHISVACLCCQKTLE